MDRLAPVVALRFRNGAQLAVVERGQNPVGAELRCLVDGEFVWSRTCQSSEELRQELERTREDFLARGWLVS